MAERVIIVCATHEIFIVCAQVTGTGVQQTTLYWL